MVALQTPVYDPSFKAPGFSLKGIDDQTHTLETCRGEHGLLVLFICNHCPYVKAIIAPLLEDCKILQQQGIGIAAIMPNDTSAYPEDGFENMKAFGHNFSFPYLLDETQQVAKAYDALCTPDIFGFNKDLSLQYRGRFAEGGMRFTPNAQREMKEAMQQIAQDGIGPVIQHSSIGCSIKWK